MIAGVSSLDEARAGGVAYVDGDRFVDAALASGAAAFVVGREITEMARPQVVVSDRGTPSCGLWSASSRALGGRGGVAADVARGVDVEIGPDVSIWPFVTLGDRVTLGAHVTLYPGVFVGAAARPTALGPAAPLPLTPGAGPSRAAPPHAPQPGGDIFMLQRQGNAEAGGPRLGRGDEGIGPSGGTRTAWLRRRGGRGRRRELHSSRGVVRHGCCRRSQTTRCGTRPA